MSPRTLDYSVLPRSNDSSPSLNEAGEQEEERSSKWPRWVKVCQVLAGLVIVLGLVRAAMPYAIQHYVNDLLDGLPDYDGQIGDVDLYLLQGRYTIKDVEIVKTSGEVNRPFFVAEHVDLSIYWTALAEGKLVGEIDLFRPQLNFVTDASGRELKQSGAGQPWIETVKSLLPVRIERLGITEGEVALEIPNEDQPVLVNLTGVVGEARGLSNRDPEASPKEPANSRAGDYPATAHFDAQIMGHAPVEVELGLSPLAEEPDVRVLLEVCDLQVTSLRKLVATYAPFDLDGGVLSFESGIATYEGDIRGYVKPVFEDINVLELDDLTEEPLTAPIDALVACLTTLLETDDTLRTEVPIRGTLDEPKVGALHAFVLLVRNAFLGVTGEASQ